jgi:hypothetical protein
MVTYKLNRWQLVWPVLATLFVPLVAAWLVYPQTHFPPGFDTFPPAFVQAAPGFSWLYFLLIACGGLLIVAFLALPQRFGFQAASLPATSAKPGPLPVWFWLGLALTLFFWWLMWARPVAMSSLIYYAFTPLWWGFILVLDGWVYRRTAGQSLLATKQRTLWISALVSVAGWGYFEFDDYFVIGNWTYPNGHMSQLSHAQIVAIFLVAYSTVWPAILEWTTLLKTYPRLASRYAQGPRMQLPAGLLLWGGLGLIGAMVVWPTLLFWAPWIGPMAAITGQLQRLGVWTPFTAIARGNWTPAVLVALGSLLNGFFWEMWNYGSAHPNVLSASFPRTPTNPNYWIYDIPYVNIIHLFSDMPLLGYIGYLPFGMLVWVVFAWAGALCGFDASLEFGMADAGGDAAK